MWIELINFTKYKNWKSIFACGFFLLFLSMPYVSQASSDEALVLRIGNYEKNIPYKTYSEWFSFSPSLSINSSYVSEIENTDFCKQKSFFCNLTMTEKLKMHLKKESNASIDKEKIEKILKAISQEVNQDPVEAIFKIENGKLSLLVADQKGLTIDLDQSEKILIELLKNNTAEKNKPINLPVREIEPEIKATDIDTLRINSLLGEGISDFRGSPLSRIHNIEVATKKYNGLLIRPEQEFSFVEALGPVDEEHGYLPELVIKQDKTEPEFGGGICQVSTTAFRAAIYSGLKIIARKNHAYPVSYYNPQGMDSTIYIPKPDLKFRNNTPGFILVQTKIEGTKLIFSFWGTDDGRKVEINGPTILEKNSDGSMKTIFTQKVTNANGTEIINDDFKSLYASPSKYPHPGTEKLTSKPDDWSKKQWELYKKTNNLS